jgi:RimJ/RimL family protein N-acetyltransferase
MAVLADRALAMRPVTVGDTDALRLILDDAAVRAELYPMTLRPLDLDDAVADWLCVDDGHRAMLCCIGETGEPVGLIQLRGGMIAFVVRAPRQRQGIGTAMLRRLVDACTGSGRVAARISRSNPASQRLVEKCGFRFVGLDYSAEVGACLRYAIDA